MAVSVKSNHIIENLPYLFTHQERVEARAQPGMFISVGWAPPGSPIGQLQNLVDEGKMHGEIKVDGMSIPVKAQVKKCGEFTGHVDQQELTDLVSTCGRLQKIFLVRREPEGISCLAESLGKAVNKEIRTEKPKSWQSFDLAGDSCGVPNIRGIPQKSGHTKESVRRELNNYDPISGLSPVDSPVFR